MLHSFIARTRLEHFLPRPIWSCCSWALQCVCSYSQMSGPHVNVVKLSLFYYHEFEIIWGCLCMVTHPVSVMYASRTKTFHDYSIEKWAALLSYPWSICSDTFMVFFNLFCDRFACQAANANVGIEQLTNKESQWVATWRICTQTAPLHAVNARSLFKISPHWPARPRQPETQNSSCMPSASAHIPQRQCRSMAETKTSDSVKDFYTGWVDEWVERP
jgi:hypothetical protein